MLRFRLWSIVWRSSLLDLMDLLPCSGEVTMGGSMEAVRLYFCSCMFTHVTSPRSPRLQIPKPLKVA
jgi:hypothetical protein